MTEKKSAEADRTKADATEVSSTDDSSVVVAAENREAVAGLVVDKYAKWSFGSGFIPAPAIDLLVLTGVQMKMLSEIAKVYGLSYSDTGVRSTIGALLGGAMPQTVGRAGLSSMLKSIPVLGTAVALVTMPVISAASTYAIGNVFIKHFESGGNFLNINLSDMKSEVSDIAAKYRNGNTSSDTKAA